MDGEAERSPHAAYRFDRFTLDLARGALLTSDGAEVPLRPKSFALLRLLVENAGRLLDRDAIMSAVWPDVLVTDDSTTQCVRDVRRALGDEAQRLLRTVPRRGYLFAAEVSRAGPEKIGPTPESVGVRRAGAVAARSVPSRPAVPVLAVLAALAVLGGVWRLWPGEPPPRERPGIAVLPFATMGGDKATERLADGLTEDVITDLARSRGIDVIARSSTEVCKGKPVDVRRIGADLGVGYVLEGSIRREGERVRVTAQLVDAGTGAHVWTDRWDRPARDVFAVQAEVAERVGAALGTPLGLGAVAASEQQRARRRPPSDLSAYEEYLLAAEAKSRRTPEGIREGIEHAGRALALDPGLARAHVLRGYLHFFTFTNGTVDFAAAMRAAEADFTRAAALDPNDAEARAALGFYYSQAGRLAESEAEIGPHSPRTHPTATFWASRRARCPTWAIPRRPRATPTRRSGSTRTWAPPT